MSEAPVTQSPVGESRPRALLLTPEAPGLGRGGGGMRVASVEAYLRRHYAVDVVTIDVVPHSKSAAARVWRNVWRLLIGRPPLWDRFSGYDEQIAGKIGAATYDVVVIEHFWCAGYVDLLRANAERLVLDLHNLESELAATHAVAAGGITGVASAQFARMYRELEQRYLPKFDVVLTASEEDRRRVVTLSEHPDVRVFPNAIPLVPQPQVPERNVILFTGNLEYHPNVEAVRWFRAEVWPEIVRRAPDVAWELAGRNPEAIVGLVAGDARIRVTGPMDDAVETLAAAKVCIVPLRSGSGTRFKILEAWAAGRAVVSTSIGAEGLGARDGQELRIADDAAVFANCVVELLEDAEARARLGAAGRKRYEDVFTWDVAWATLDHSGGL